MKNNTQVLINCHNNKKLVGRVKAFDGHCNMVLEEVKEIWTELPKMGKGREKARPVHKDRFLSKMFLRGDSVILGIKIGEEMLTKPEGYSANNIAMGPEDTYTTTMTSIMSQ